jgi:major membrane immunogen (membrane-anchored lipoprotein)
MTRALLIAAILVVIFSGGCGSDDNSASARDYDHVNVQPNSDLANVMTNLCKPRGGVITIEDQNGEHGWTDFFLVVCKDGTVHRVNPAD